MQKSLTQRAKLYARILVLLYQQKGIAGRIEQVSRGARHMSFGIRLQDPTRLSIALSLGDNIALASKTEMVLAHRMAGRVQYQYQLPSIYWETYTRQDVTGLGIGLGERRRQIDIRFDDAPHTLVAGTTGSGKSVTIQSALLALVNTYTPDDLGLIIADPHDDHSRLDNCAHLVAPIATNEDEIDVVLTYAHEIFLHRRQNKIKDDKRIVIVIDEGDELMAANSNRLAILRNLVNGRKFNVNVIFGSLKPLHRNIPGILDKLQNRYIGVVSDAGMSAQLTGRAGMEAHKLTGKGDFLHIIGATADRFQVVNVTDSDFASLDRIEVQQPTVNGYPVNDIEPDPEPTPGRPRAEIEPDILADYLAHGNNSLSVRKAQQLGYGRTIHGIHKAFTMKLLHALRSKNLYLCEGGCSE